jgi:hypothetical protein
MRGPLMTTTLVNVLPTWLLGVVIIGGATLFTVGAALILRKRVRSTRTEGHNEIVGFIFATVGVIYAVLLALVVFSALGQDRGLWSGASFANVRKRPLRQASRPQLPLLAPGLVQKFYVLCLLGHQLLHARFSLSGSRRYLVSGGFLPGNSRALCTLNGNVTVH